MALPGRPLHTSFVPMCSSTTSGRYCGWVQLANKSIKLHLCVWVRRGGAQVKLFARSGDTALDPCHHDTSSPRALNTPSAILDYAARVGGITQQQPPPQQRQQRSLVNGKRNQRLPVSPIQPRPPGHTTTPRRLFPMHTRTYFDDDGPMAAPENPAWPRALAGAVLGPVVNGPTKVASTPLSLSSCHRRVR